MPLCSVDENLLTLKAVSEEESPHNVLSEREDQITYKNGSLVEKLCLKSSHTVLDGGRNK